MPFVLRQTVASTVVTEWPIAEADAAERRRTVELTHSTMADRARAEYEGAADHLGSRIAAFDARYEVVEIE